VKNEAGEEIAIADLFEKTDGPGGLRRNPCPRGIRKDCRSSSATFFPEHTLFAGSIGRTDLWGGSMHKIMESLRTKLMHLPDERSSSPATAP